MPKISIIITVYNSSKFLKKCLDSVINQSLKDIEIICVDDCSTDNSLEILQEYAKNDDRIILLQQEKNQGQGVARNKAMQIAKGEYIGFVDSDDWIGLNTYKKAYNWAKETNADLINWGMEIIPENEDTDELLIKDTKRYHEIKLVGLYNWEQELYRKTTCTPCNKIFKSEIIKNYDIKFPEISRYEDEEFYVKYLLHCKQIYFSNEKNYYYLKRNKSTTGQDYSESNSNNKLLLIDIYYNVYKYYEKHNVLEKENDFLNQLFNYFIPSAYYGAYNKELAIDKMKELSKKIDNNILQNHTLKLIQENKIDKLYFLDKNSFLENIFSLKNKRNHKILTLLGIKIKFKRKKNGYNRSFR